MGTNVIAFSKHNLPITNGNAIVKELEKRLNSKIYYRTQENYKTIDVKLKWSFLLYHFQKEWVSNADEIWRDEKQLEFYFEREDNQAEGLIIFPELAEIDCPDWNDWKFFCEDLISRKLKRWIHYRSQIKNRALQLGASEVIYLSDKIDEDLIFSDGEFQTNSYETLIKSGIEKGCPVWNVCRQESMNGIDPATKIYNTIIYDDFSD